MRRVQAGAQRLADWEIWPVALAVAAGGFVQRLLPLSVAVAAVFWVIQWVANGTFHRRTLVDLPMALLALMILVSLAVTTTPDQTYPQTLRLLSGMAMLYAILRWTTTLIRLRVLTLCTVAAGLGLALSAPFVVYASGFGTLPFLPRWLYPNIALGLSNQVNANVMAGALVILAPFAVGPLLFAWHPFNRLERVFFGVSALLITSIIVWTQARGALLATGIVLLAVVGLRFRRASTALAIGLGASILLGGAFLTIWVSNVSAASDALSGLPSRIEIWQRGVWLIQDFPLTGSGMGGFRHGANLLYPFVRHPEGVLHAHQLFLQVAVDLGLPGIVAWMALTLLVAFAGWTVYRAGQATGDVWVAGLGAAFVCSLLALLIQGVTDAPTWGVFDTAPIPWGLWGLTIAAWNLYVARLA